MKLCIIVGYLPSSDRDRSLRLDIDKYILETINSMLLQGFRIVLLGDFNASPEKLRQLEPDPQFAKAIPSRTDEIRGPVNIFRPEYGRWWLIDKTGDEHFERKLGIAERGEYTYYEALNLANGKRSVAEIRNILSAEFDPIPAADVYQFFKFLEGVGVIRMETTK